MKLTISSILLLVLGVSQVSSKRDCHTREIDGCLSTAMFLYQSRGIPDDEEKVTEWCETIKEVRDCMSNYSVSCMSPMQRELTQLVDGGASDAEIQLCQPGSEMRNNYLKHGPCLAEGAESDTFKTVTKDLQVAIETLFDVPFKQRLPLMCCGAQRFHRDAEDNTRRSCGEEAVEMLKTIMNMIFTELPSTVCQNFDPKSDTCTQILPPSGTTPKGSESKSHFAKLMATMFGN